MPNRTPPSEEDSATEHAQVGGMGGPEWPLKGFKGLKGRGLRRVQVSRNKMFNKPSMLEKVKSLKSIVS